MANKYNNETLTNYCKENQIILTKDYSEIKVTRDTIIHGKCINKCDKEFQKNFRRMVENSGAICLDCQKNFTSFNINFLNKFVKDNNITLIDEYKNVTRDTKIKGKCNNNLCNNNFEKNFRYLVEDGGPYCDICTKEKKFEKFKDEMNKKYGCDYFIQCDEGKEKIKNVVIEKYGVENISQNKEIREKIKKTFLIKYGTEHPSQNQEIKEKIIKTNNKKYGVDNPMQNINVINKLKNTNIQKYGTTSPLQNVDVNKKTIKTNIEKFNTKFPSQNKSIKQKIKNTNLNKFGVDYPLLNIDIKQKSINTLINNYGVDNPLKSSEIREKIKQTNLNKYGVEHVAQNPQIMEKISKNSYSRKKYTSPTGKIFTCQGYEPQALNYLINIDKVDENNIINGESNVPKIEYFDDNNKKHIHYPDIFIKQQNKLIDAKSTWTVKKDYVFEKQKAAKEQGYLYEIWVMNKKGDLLEKHT